MYQSHYTSVFTIPSVTQLTPTKGASMAFGVSFTMAYSVIIFVSLEKSSMFFNLKFLHLKAGDTDSPHFKGFFFWLKIK